MTEPLNPRTPLLHTLNKVPLILQIFIGIVVGIILAVIFPTDTVVIPTFGNLFVKALRSVAPILVFVLVSAAIARHSKGTKSNMKPIIALYFITMLMSATLALIMSYMFPSYFGILADAVSADAPQGISEVLLNFLGQAIDNPVNALLEANYIGILIWAVLLGLMFRVAHDHTKGVLDDLAKSVSGVVFMVIRFAPLGVMGLVYTSCTADGGFSNLFGYLHVICVLVGTMIGIALILNPIVVYLCIRKNPYPLIFTTLTRSAVTAFFTRSSAANLPVNLKLCEDLKLPKETYTISVPLGATINMSGAAVTIVILTMAAVHTVGIQVDFGSALLMCVVSVLCACGASGVAGGSLMLIPLACSIFGISNDVAMQVVGIGFIIGVIQDSAETALNSSTDVLFTAAICMRAERLEQEKKQKAAAA